MKDETYIISFDEHELIGSHWFSLHVNGNNGTYFDSSGVEHIAKEVIKLIGNKNITTNSYRI